MSNYIWYILLHGRSVNFLWQFAVLTWRGPACIGSLYYFFKKIFLIKNSIWLKCILSLKRYDSFFLEHIFLQYSLFISKYTRRIQILIAWHYLSCVMYTFIIMTVLTYYQTCINFANIFLGLGNIILENPRKFLRNFPWLKWVWSLQPLSYRL